ncbi:MAG: hypothetical protein AVDCRST_MAG89-5484 [uncultured Gemmatimonadetes bacterium]|uniref:Uncharacterized protein n=1 Tax=uncultured Gemmatimonadota bacterium TaxID=203437 RepID=A0A6J4N9T2_9BACT|nr:MAG: hypothetical protein AVDCRST_MAG89-5484 [uncultured Gemmatimonadota bacterium]
MVRRSGADAGRGPRRAACGGGRIGLTRRRGEKHHTEAQRERQDHREPLSFLSVSLCEIAVLSA